MHIARKERKPPFLIEHLVKLSDFGSETNGRSTLCEPGTISLVLSIVPQAHTTHKENCVITLLKQDGKLFTRPIYSFDEAITNKKWFRVMPSSETNEQE